MCQRRMEEDPDTDTFVVTVSDDTGFHIHGSGDTAHDDGHR